MANRSSRQPDAEWQLHEIGRELRVSRVTAGLRQADVARALRTSTARISLIERGRLPPVAYRDLARFAATVGLRMSLRAYPTGHRLLDSPQLALFERLRSRIHSSWSLRTEVPMPIPGDLRATDCVASIPGCTIAIELITRLADFQAQSRAALLKTRDLAASRCILVLAASHANRRALRAVGPTAWASFPIGSRAALRALAAGRDPKANAVILL